MPGRAPGRRAQELDLVVRLVRERAQPEARSERARKLTEEPSAKLGVDAGAEVVRHPKSVFGIGPIEEHCELVPAEPRDEVGRPKPLLEDLPHLSKDVIPGPVPQVVVDVLEAVEIAEQEAERGLIPLRPGHFGLDSSLLEIGGVVPEPGQIVEVGHELGLPQLLRAP